MKSVGIIGFGVMGEAFASCLARKLPSAALAVFDSRKERRDAASGRPGVIVASSASDVFRSSEITVLSIKPQDLSAFSSEVKSAAGGKAVISILAGQSTEVIARATGTDQVARFMPNLAAVKGASVVGVSFHPAASEKTREDARAVAAALGAALEIPEKLMGAMTGVSGSGLAFVLQFIHGLALGGVACGFDYRSALAVAVGTVEGAASLLKDGAHPIELANRVTSPAGTTIQGVRALEKAAFTAAVMEAVEAAARKANEFEA